MAVHRDSRHTVDLDCVLDGFIWGFACHRVLLRRDVPFDAFETGYSVPHAGEVSRFEDGHRGERNSIPKDAIHRIIVRNHVLKAASKVIVVADPNVNSGQQNVVAGMNWAIRNPGPISYRVDAEARGVPTTLAGGLTEPTAPAIMMDGPLSDFSSVRLQPGGAECAGRG